MAVVVSQMITRPTLAVTGATGEASEEMKGKSETSATGREKGRCRRSLLAQRLCARAADRGAKRAMASARTRHLGVRVDLKMDHDLHAANSPSAHPRNGSLPHLSSIANGALE